MGCSCEYGNITIREDDFGYSDNMMRAMRAEIERLNRVVDELSKIAHTVCMICRQRNTNSPDLVCKKCPLVDFADSAEGISKGAIEEESRRWADIRGWSQAHE